MLALSQPSNISSLMLHDFQYSYGSFLYVFDVTTSSRSSYSDSLSPNAILPPMYVVGLLLLPQVLNLDSLLVLVVVIAFLPWIFDDYLYNHVQDILLVLVTRNSVNH